MDLINGARVGTGVILLLRWIARLASLASVGLLSLFFFGTLGSPTPGEAIALAFFPIGVALGMLMGWWREAWGGWATLLSLAAFYLWMIVLAGHPPRGPYFLLFAAPGLLFLVCSLIERRRPARYSCPA
jgi:hypothetical protein